MRVCVPLNSIDVLAVRVQYIPEFPNIAAGFSDQRLAGITYSSSAEYNTDLFVSQLAGVAC